MKICAVTLIMALLTGCAFAGESLTYSDHEPLGNMRTKFLADVFFPAVEKESHGRVKIIPHWNAEISTGYDALKALRAGSADLAVVVPEYGRVSARRT